MCLPGHRITGVVLLEYGAVQVIGGGETRGDRGWLPLYLRSKTGGTAVLFMTYSGLDGWVGPAVGLPECLDAVCIFQPNAWTEVERVSCNG